MNILQPFKCVAVARRELSITVEIKHLSTEISIEMEHIEKPKLAFP